MKNKNFMIFQTAVRKYVGINEKSLSGYLFVFYPQISVIKTTKKIGQKMRKIFIMLRFVFKFLRFQR
jgi:hypothetical protein